MPPAHVLTAVVETFPTEVAGAAFAPKHLPAWTPNNPLINKRLFVDERANHAKRQKVCFAFLTGKCALGRQCHGVRPDEETCRTIFERYSKTDCQWGQICTTKGCLFRHPTNETERQTDLSQPSTCWPVHKVDWNGKTEKSNQGTSRFHPSGSEYAETLQQVKEIYHSDSGYREWADYCWDHSKINIDPNGHSLAFFTELPYQH